MKNNQAVYQKWLRYYLDFCRKYNFPQTQRGSLTHFLMKLQEKKQTKAQQDQASHSISLYYELILAKDTLKTYSGRVRKLQTYTKSKDPRLVSVDDVKTFVAVNAYNITL